MLDCRVRLDMRRVVFTAFLMFYSLSVVARTVERTTVWVAEHKHPSQPRHDHGPAIAEPVKYSPQPVQTKLFEDGWFLVAPFVQSSDPPYFQSALCNWLAGFVAGPNSPTAAPRAPPSLY